MVLCYHLRKKPYSFMNYSDNILLKNKWQFEIFRKYVHHTLNWSLVVVTGCWWCSVYLDGNWLWVEDCEGGRMDISVLWVTLLWYTTLCPPLTIINSGMLILSDIADIMQTQIVTPSDWFHFYLIYFSWSKQTWPKINHKLCGDVWIRYTIYCYQPNSKSGV